MQESCGSALHWDERPVMGSLVVTNGHQEDMFLNGTVLSILGPMLNTNGRAYVMT